MGWLAKHKRIWFRLGILVVLPIVACLLLWLLLLKPVDVQERTHSGPAKYRRLSDIALTTNLTEAQVYTVWGEPDRREGSGIDYQVYQLEDGRELWIV